MSEALEIKEQKAVKSRTYACCPICSKTLVQADYIRNGIIKCETAIVVFTSIFRIMELS